MVFLSLQRTSVITLLPYKSVSCLPQLRFRIINQAKVSSNKRVLPDSVSSTTAPVAKRIHTDAAMSYGTAKSGIKMSVKLTGKEESICDLLCEVSDYIARERPELPRIVARIAGGWVRDKLLGNECHDIDIAVNDMTGFEFATYTNTFMKQNGLPTSTVTKIDRNPAKSKHLETATSRIFNQEVDFANLRGEIHDQDEGIQAFGTPKEDAERRDITINSLFYNVETRMVEDHTDKGISDLQEGLIRTPLTPQETFSDDPLRVLRCVRFASRFGFTLTPELVEAAKSTPIKDALRTNISKERFGTELGKMIRGPLPLYAIRLLCDLEVYNIVFNVPGDIVSGQIQQPPLAIKATGAVQWLSQHTIRSLRPETKEELRTLHLGAYLFPFVGAMASQKNKTIPAVQLVLRDSIKASNTDISAITTVFRGIPLWKNTVSKNVSAGIGRSELGMMIRDIGPLWRTSLRLALISELLALEPNASWPEPGLLKSDIGATLCTQYRDFIDKASHYCIMDCHQWKPVFNGKKVASILGIKPGPIIGDLLQDLMAWQLDHPEASEQDCIDSVMEIYNRRKH